MVTGEEIEALHEELEVIEKKLQTLIKEVFDDKDAYSEYYLLRQNLMDASTSLGNARCDLRLAEVYTDRVRANVPSVQQ